MFTMPTWIRRLAAPALALAVALPAAGCGGGGDHYEVYGGTLEVVNNINSFEVLEVVEISQPFGPVESYIVDLFPGETFEVDLFPDFYDVDVFWSDGFVEGVTVDIEDGLFTTVVFTN